MDIQRGPIADGAILGGRHGADAHFRMCAENRVADIGALSRHIQTDHKKIGQSLMHALGNFRLVSHFSDDFDARLIRQRLKNRFPHEPRSVSHEDPNCLVHGSLLVLSIVSVSLFLWKSEDSKKHLMAGLSPDSMN